MGNKYLDSMKPFFNFKKPNNKQSPTSGEGSSSEPTFPTTLHERSAEMAVDDWLNKLPTGDEKSVGFDRAQAYSKELGVTRSIEFRRLVDDYSYNYTIKVQTDDKYNSNFIEKVAIDFLFVLLISKPVINLEDPITHIKKFDTLKEYVKHTPHTSVKEVIEGYRFKTDPCPEGISWYSRLDWFTEKLIKEDYLTNMRFYLINKGYNLKSFELNSYFNFLAHEFFIDSKLKEVTEDLLSDVMVLKPINIYSKYSPDFYILLMHLVEEIDYISSK